MVTLDQFLEKLEEYGEVRPSGNGYVACCPAHEDSEPSLGVTEADGKILLNCYAGCENEEIVKALELTWGDLRTDQEERPNLAEPESVFSYQDEQGNELFQALRFPGKRFRQRHMVAYEWVWNLDGVRRVLFHLPEVIEAKYGGVTIYVCEGEKDVETLRNAGKTATCNPMGAGSWRPEYADMLAGASTVIIVADRDEVGRKHAETARDSLIGKVQNLHVVRAKTGKDASDHLAAGHSVEEFVVERKAARRGIITAREMADAATEELELGPGDLPGYVFTPEIPLVFRQGRMYAIGAYTGDGKTCYALQGLRTLGEAGKRVGYFSLEMPERDLRNRLVCHKGVPLSLLEEPWRLRQSPEGLATYEQAIEELRHWNTDIIFDSAMNAEKVWEITRDRDYEAVIIDHVHRFGWGHERRKLEEQVTQLTNLALEQNVLVVILCQLRRYMRGQQFEAYPRPTLQDFRETEMIGQDAAMALAVWRQRDGGGMGYTGHTEAIVLKNRHTTGAINRAGHTYLPYFDPMRQMFVPKQEVPVVQTAA
jgi:5S rRNA maturation endonuclease (ribonuclease M5)